LAPCHVVYIPAVAGVPDVANVPADDYVPAVARNTNIGLLNFVTRKKFINAHLWKNIKGHKSPTAALTVCID
jgi:hypothetical protein